MIEIVYKEETEAEDTNIKLPHNVKQIGTGGGTRKVYVEDYAAGFIKNTPKREEEIRYGVLIGNIKRCKTGIYVFVHGIVEAKEHVNIKFDDEIWTEIYEEIKNYYTENEIVGWFLNVPATEREWRVEFQKIHLDNFAGNDKICFLYDRSEREESIYSYDSGMMQKRCGYFVYYEKNPEMQAYMIDKNPDNAENAKKDIRVESGSIHREQTGIKRKAGSRGRKISALMQPASTFLAVAVLMATVTLMSNHGQMQKLKKSLDDIAGSVTGGKFNTETVGQTNEQQDTALVEVIQGEVDTTPEETVTAAGEVQSSTEETQTTQASTDYNFYIVGKGETLSRICEKIYGTQDRKAEVMEANGITDENKIYIGQKIILP